MDVVEAQVKDKDAKAPMDIGAVLVESRENKNLSSQDIADGMNLTLSVITSIEANEFEQDIPLTFIRGYVRSYAQKVGVDVENICVEFDRQTGQSAEPIQKIKVVSNFKIRRKEINSNSFLFKSVTYLIIASLLAFGGWELWKKFSKSKANDTPVINEIQLSTSTSAPESLPVQSANNVQVDSATTDTGELAESGESQIVDSNTASPIANRNDDTASNQASVSSAAVSNEQAGIQNSTQNAEVESAVIESNDAPVAEPALITGPIASANFQFSADCWVKVTDANNEVIAVGIKKAGYLMPIEGVTPMTVVLGEPSAVSIEFNGEAYDLSNFRAGRRARFVLE